MSHEPALRFWLGWAEQEGALVEDAGDHALLVLPERLQEATGCPRRSRSPPIPTSLSRTAPCC